MPKTGDEGESLTTQFDAWNRAVAARDSGNNLIARYEYDGADRRIVNANYEPIGGTATTRLDYFHDHQGQEINTYRRFSNGLSEPFERATIFRGELVRLDRAPAAGTAPHGVEDGDVYAPFGSGTVQANWAALDEQFADAEQQDTHDAGFGRVLVTGRSVGSGDLLMVRYLSDGQLDPEFGPGGFVVARSNVTYAWQATALQDDGKILALGYGATYGSAALVRFNADGSLDESFGGGDGVAEIDIGDLVNPRIALSGNGIFLSGATPGYGTVFVGALDYSGTQTAVSSVSSISDGHSMVVDQDGRAYLGYASGGNVTVRRLTVQGTNDAAFGQDGAATILNMGIADAYLAWDTNTPTDNANLLVYGTQPSLGSTNDAAVFAKLTQSGNATTPWGTNLASVLLPDGGSVGRLAIQPDNKILLSSLDDDARPRLLRLTPAAALDSTFAEDGVLVTDQAAGYPGNSFALNPAGLLFVTGGPEGYFTTHARYVYAPAYRGEVYAEQYRLIHGPCDRCVSLVDRAGRIVERYGYDATGRRLIFAPDGTPRDQSLIGLEQLNAHAREDQSTRLRFEGNTVYNHSLGRYATAEETRAWVARQQADIASGRAAAAYASRYGGYWTGAAEGGHAGGVTFLGHLSQDGDLIAYGDEKMRSAGVSGLARAATHRISQAGSQSIYLAATLGTGSLARLAANYDRVMTVSQLSDAAGNLGELAWNGDSDGIGQMLGHLGKEGLWQLPLQLLASRGKLFAHHGPDRCNINEPRPGPTAARVVEDGKVGHSVEAPVRTAAADTIPAGQRITTYYLPNRGFLGNPATETLQPGVRIDRFGFEGGTFTAPVGTPVPMRALPPGATAKPYNVYEVVKPIDVKSGPAAPWFDQPGLGTQYEMPAPIQQLIEQGYLKRVGG